MSGMWHLDVDDEPIPALPGYDQMLFDRRKAAIEAATPPWVRRCRGMGHHVALGEKTEGVFTFHCTGCGKDRP